MQASRLLWIWLAPPGRPSRRLRAGRHVPAAAASGRSACSPGAREYGRGRHLRASRPGAGYVSLPSMETFPAMPLSQWADTKETLHRFAQVVGKIRLAASVRRNHWWNVPFHLTGRGITTRPMGTDPIFTIDFDFVSHLLLVQSVTGQATSFPLPGQSVASFYQR